MRRGEAAAVRASYIDLARRTICLPSTLVKNSREHLFPIGVRTAELLSRAAKPAQDTGFISPARGNVQTSFSGWSKSKTRLDFASGIKNWTLHDLRGTFATRLAELGVAPHVIERQGFDWLLLCGDTLPRTLLDASFRLLEEHACAPSSSGASFFRPICGHRLAIDFPASTEFTACRLHLALRDCVQARQEIPAYKTN
jgi:hypothetical protein